MRIVGQCPFCGAKWLCDERAADCRLRCSDCRRLFKVPSLKEMPGAVRIVEQAKGPVYVDESGKTYG